MPPWPNGQGVGFLIRRLRVRVPQGVYLRMCMVMYVVGMHATQHAAVWHTVSQPMVRSDRRYMWHSRNTHTQARAPALCYPHDTGVVW